MRLAPLRIALVLLVAACGDAATTLAPGRDAAAAADRASSGCTLPGGAACAPDASCPTAACDGGGVVACACAGGERLRCAGACAAAAADGGSAGCVLPDGSLAPVGGSRQVGWCPGGAPLLCYCAADLTIVCPSGCS